MAQEVYIPSRGRWGSANKTAHIWQDQGFRVTFIVEPHEWNNYERALDTDFNIHELPYKNGGIGHTRNFLISLAASYGLQSIIMADDDMRPKRNMLEMVEAARHNKVLGITARYSYHDLVLGPRIKDRDDLVLLPSLTFKLIAINVRNALDIGNFDPKLDGLEDNDFALRGLEAGYPWMIHLGTYSTATGPRYAPGGLSDYCETRNISPEFDVPPWYDKMYAKWPDFISGHKTQRIRFAWRNAYDKLIPGWKRYSDLDGGSLKEYLGAS
jgi:hypothetical protein